MSDRRGLRSYLFCDSGGVAVIFGLVGPALLFAVGGAFEYAKLTSRQATIQRTADEAALAGAQQLRLVNNSDDVVLGAVQRVIDVHTAKNAQSEVDVETIVGDGRTSVAVQISEKAPGLFGKLFTFPTMEVAVKSKARLSGTRRICLLTLDVDKGKVLNLDKNSVLTAPSCGLYSNSIDKKGLSIEQNSRITASQICSAGGVDQKAGTLLSPVATVDCPQIADPLASIPRPKVGPCVATDLKVTTAATLTPGTYCGGIEIVGSADVTLFPGVYVLDNGPLIVSGKAKLIGRDVGFHFTGSKGGMRLDTETTISLSAPKTGEMAGILFFEDRSVTAPIAPPAGPKGDVPPAPYGSQPMRQYRITSNNAPTLLGTIYLPAGRLIIDASQPVASRSAYTVIVARQLELNSGPNLVLNADYEGSSVPVPQGVGPNSGHVALSR